MLEQGYITQEQYEIATATPIEDGLQPSTNNSAYPAYMDNYLKEVIEEVESKTGYNLLTTGMDVYTNVDSAAQQELWNIYNTDTYVTYPDENFQVASTVVDVANGHVVAQLGSRNQDASVSFGTNQAVESNRDFGSTMKPITDYAPALENGVYTSTGDIIRDEPYKYPGTTTPVYNWDKDYYGSISLKTAIQYSRNVTAVKALEATGLDKANAFLNSIGIYYPQLLYSNAISSNTTDSNSKYGASSEKMAAAYASFANGGTYYAPQYVNKIIFSDGTTSEYAPEGKKVMTAETAYMMTDMLKGVMTFGTGLNGAVYGVPMAGKTGTSNYTDEQLESILAANEEARYSYMAVPDENFVGYSTRYAMAVWTGYSDRNTPVLDDGMKIATDVFRNMMAYLNPLETASDWEMPDGLYLYGNNLYLEGASPRYTYTPSPAPSPSTETSSSVEESSTIETSSSSSTSTSSSIEEPVPTPASSSEEPSTTDDSSTSPSSTDTEPIASSSSSSDSQQTVPSLSNDNFLAILK